MEVTPFYQFEIINLIFLNFSNLFFYYVPVIVVFFFIFIRPNKKFTILPTTNQYILESIYNFILDIFRQQIAVRGSLAMFPIVFTFFIFILILNLIGLTPFGFTITSHALVTFILSISVFIMVTLNGFRNQKLSFLNLFIPSGLSKFALPFMVPLELNSHFIKPLSLGIRLFANMLAGHILLFIIGKFVIYIYSMSPLLAIFPSFFIFGVSLLEVGIAFIQSYVFTVLFVIYTADSYKIDH